MRKALVLAAVLVAVFATVAAVQALAGDARLAYAAPDSGWI